MYVVVWLRHGRNNILGVVKFVGRPGDLVHCAIALGKGELWPTTRKLLPTIRTQPAEFVERLPDR